MVAQVKFRVREKVQGDKLTFRDGGFGIHRIEGAGLLYQVVLPVDHKMPGAAMPVVCPEEIEHPLSFHIEGNIPVLLLRKEEMAGIRSLIETPSVISTPHIGPDAQSLLWPEFPHAIGIGSHRQGGMAAGWAETIPEIIHTDIIRGIIRIIPAGLKFFMIIVLSLSLTVNAGEGKGSRSWA